jgi:hypothetical protein
MPPSAHIAGIPVEETLLSFGPVLLAVLAAASASAAQRQRRIRARLRSIRSFRRPKRRSADPGSG